MFIVISNSLYDLLLLLYVDFDDAFVDIFVDVFGIIFDIVFCPLFWIDSIPFPLCDLLTLCTLFPLWYILPYVPLSPSYTPLSNVLFSNLKFAFPLKPFRLKPLVVDILFISLLVNDIYLLYYLISYYY